MLGTNNQLRKSKKKRLTVFLFAFFFFAVTAVIVFSFIFQNSFQITPQQVRNEIIRIWNDGEYEKVVDIATNQLNQNPLNSEFLFLRGSAFYYLAQQQVNFDTQSDQFNAAIIDLRRALLTAERELRGQIHYILGKTYFHKGYFYFDLSYYHLFQSQEYGFHQPDSFEHLGLVSAELGNVTQGIDFLIHSHNENPRSILLITVARLFASTDQFEQAINYALSAFESSDDSFEQEQALLIAGSAYRFKENWVEAENVYRRLFDLNNNSADAKFYLGEVYASKGDLVQARVFWREAFAINPQHPGAISRLNS
jgi:tetratricopeptide (TPR) repeat protein